MQSPDFAAEFQSLAWNSWLRELTTREQTLDAVLRMLRFPGAQTQNRNYRILPLSIFSHLLTKSVKS